MRFKQIAAIACAALIGVSTLAGCQVGETNVIIAEELERKDAFRVNKETASLAEAYLFLSEYRNDYGNVHGIDVWEQEGIETSFDSYVKEISLTAIAKVYTVADLAKSQQIELSAQETELVEAMAKVYYDSLDSSEARKLGIDQDVVTNVCAHYTLAQKYFRTVTGNIDDEISDNDARVMQVQEIFVSDADTANTIEQSLAEGNEFSSLFSYSETDTSAKYITRSDIPVEAEDAVYILNDGEVTDKITTEDGFYFFKCLNYYDVEKTALNKLSLESDILEEAFESVYEDYCTSVDSELNTSAWAKVTVKDCTVVTDQSIFLLYDTYFGQE